ncbi:MAG: ABC transporter permease [Candidatus Bathyarchaeota archaeon]|nr:MAG: ABC transporter permease [Candidatus Bathyarchaeota archaeon]
MSLEIIEIILRSIYVSGTATLLSAVWSLPLGLTIGVKNFYGKRFVKGVFNAFLGMPTVVLGLVLFLLIRHAGPFGFLNLMFTPLAIIVGQAVLITPIMVSFITSAVESIDSDIRDLAKTLGATEIQASLAVLKEATGGTLLAFIASFNRAIAEMGIAYMVGGSIPGFTMVLTTAIALQRDMANIELGLTLAAILLSIVFAINLTLNLIQKRKP